MWLIATNVRCSVVCQCVCVLGTLISCAKMAEPIMSQFGRTDSWAQRPRTVLDTVQCSSEGAILRWGKTDPLKQYMDSALHTIRSVWIINCSIVAFRTASCRLLPPKPTAAMRLAPPLLWQLIFSLATLAIHHSVITSFIPDYTKLSYREPILH